MKSVQRILFVATIVLLFAGCQQDIVTNPPGSPPPSTPATTQFDAERAAGELLSACAWEIEPGVEVPTLPAGPESKRAHYIGDWSREVLGGDIVHYEFLLQVGRCAYDQIKIHRVVRERRPMQPIKSRHAIMLQHGDGVGFVKFLYGHAAPSVPDDHALAIYLAQQDIDVWGLDQNWVLVPGETSEFGFMQDWGMDNQIENLRAALATARYTRLYTGNGFRKMHLLGYSSGGATGYAYINDEATIPYGHRHVRGYVCADMIYKYAPEYEASRQFICADVAFMDGQLASGIYQLPISFEPIGRLAALDPLGDSPFIPGFTNLQVALLFGGASFNFFPLSPWYHYWGATFDSDTGLPVDFNFVSIDNATDFMRLACPWEALRFCYDYERIMCGEEDVPWDDNLAEIDLPVLLLEPAGGMGMVGRHTLTLLGSTDIQIVTASLRPPEQVTEDFGHIDMFTSPLAVDLIWQPLLNWIVTHEGRDSD